MATKAPIIGQFFDRKAGRTFHRVTWFNVDGTNTRTFFSEIEALNFSRTVAQEVLDD